MTQEPSIPSALLAEWEADHKRRMIDDALFPWGLFVIQDDGCLFLCTAYATGEEALADLTDHEGGGDAEAGGPYVVGRRTDVPHAKAAGYQPVAYSGRA